MITTLRGPLRARTSSRARSKARCCNCKRSERGSPTKRLANARSDNITFSKRLSLQDTFLLERLHWDIRFAVLRPSFKAFSTFKFKSTRLMRFSIIYFPPILPSLTAFLQELRDLLANDEGEKIVANVNDKTESIQSNAAIMRVLAEERKVGFLKEFAPSLIFLNPRRA